MPVYNAKKYVAEAIQSVINQTYEKWELLIINDGSTDDSRNEILKYSDARIVFFEQKNKGVSAARNLGLRNMTGDFFCFLDADDTFPKDSLLRRLNGLENKPNFNVLDSSVSVRDDKLETEIRRYTPLEEENPQAELCRLNPNVFFGPNWFFKRDRNINYLFEEGLSHGEDLLFYLTYSENLKRTTIKEVALHYRTGTASAMSNLKGLEKGYKEIGEKMKALSFLKKEDVDFYKKKSKSIMFKSYIGNLKFLAGVKVLIRWTFD